MYRPRYYGQAAPSQQMPAAPGGSAQAMLRKAAGKRIATISTHPEYFEEGVRSTTKDQVGNAIASGQAWRDNLIAAMNAGTWEAGLQKTGTEGWRQATIQKSQNWVVGATSPISQARYEQNFAPIVETIAATLPQLPARVMPVVGDENTQRVAILNRAVHQTSQAMKGAPYGAQTAPVRAEAGAPRRYTPGYTYPPAGGAPRYYGRRY